jgi:hypothetical protein
MLVGADDRRVQEQGFQVGIAAEGLHDTEPNARIGPAVEPLEDRVPETETFGQVAPARPGPSDPEHGIAKEPIIPGRGAGGLRAPGQEEFDARPLLVGHLKAACHVHLREESQGFPVLPGLPHHRNVIVNTT